MKNLVFLPGMLCDERLFTEQIEFFQNHNWQIYTPKLTGHKDKLLGQAQELLQDLPEQFAIVAVSLGGSVALEIIKQVPNNVSHLVLMGAVDTAFISEQEVILNQQIQLAKDTDYLTVVKEKLKVNYIYNLELADKKLLNLIIEMAAEFDIKSWEAQANLLRGRKSYREVLVNFPGKTLICAGQYDQRISLDIVHEMAKARQQAAYLFDDCGHLPSIENPQLVTEVLQKFLAN